MTDTRPLQPDDLYRLRLISDPQISPGGAHAAFVLKQMDREQNDYRSNIYLADDTGSIRQLTFGDSDWGPRWSPDGAHLAFVSGRTGKQQIRLLPMTGGESRALTDLPLGAGLPVWSPDSRAIAFVAQVEVGPEGLPVEPAERKEETPAPSRVVRRASYKLDGAGYVGDRRRHLFVVDVQDGALRQLTEGDHHNDHPAWSPDGRWIAFASGRTEHWDVTGQSDIRLLARDGDEASVLVQGGQFSRPAFSPEGDRVALYGHPEEDSFFTPGRLLSVDRQGGDLRDELGAWDGALGNQVLSDVVQSAEPHGIPVVWRPEGILFLGTERGEVNVYRARDGRVGAVTRGAHTVTDFSVSREGALTFACADARHLAEVWVQRDGPAQQITHENGALLDEVLLIAPERLQYRGERGEWGEGWLLAPPGHDTGRHPLIIYIHGGPMLAHGEALSFEYQLLAGQGFGVFYPNIHGSASYGREYLTAIRGDWGNLDYRDVLAGLEEAKRRSWVDLDRLGMAGGSYGGYMTTWAIGHGAPVRAALAERCVCNLVSFVGTSDFGWAWDREFGTFPEGDVQRLWDMSPLKYVEGVQVPVLILHSERDDRTPLEQGEQFFNALRRLRKPATFMVFPEESHGLTRMGKPRRRVERLEAVVNWFQDQLR